MFKRLLWIVFFCAVVAGVCVQGKGRRIAGVYVQKIGQSIHGAYVQEMGRRIPNVSAAVRAGTQCAQKCWDTCSGVARSKLALLEKPAQKNKVIKQQPASVQQSFVSGAQVTASGTVVRILPDDNVGSRHQKFSVKLASGRTLLIAHNIDLASRIANLSTGDTVSFCGEYASNDKGGVIHWTHRDPANHHPAGWIQHGGKTYQ